MLGAELVLLLALSQQPATVTLIVEGREQVVTVEQAKELLKSDDLRLQVAATLALGTSGPPQPAPGLPNTRERHDWEIMRGVRLPAQGQQ